ncbi:MAG: helix-turn-helix domain-containing protein [Candidatus Spyradocola sp.]
MQLQQAVSIRLSQLLQEKRMTQYQLFIKTGVPKSTIHNVIHGNYHTIKLSILYEICQGLGVGLEDFFACSLFDEENLEP